MYVEDINATTTPRLRPRAARKGVGPRRGLAEQTPYQYGCCESTVFCFEEQRNQYNPTRNRLVTDLEILRYILLLDHQAADFWRPGCHQGEHDDKLMPGS